MKTKWTLFLGDWATGPLACLQPVAELNSWKGPWREWERERESDVWKESVCGLCGLPLHPKIAEKMRRFTKEGQSMICVMFKTWYMGYGHPSIVRNPAVGYGIQLFNHSTLYAGPAWASAPSGVKGSQPSWSGTNGTRIEADYSPWMTVVKVKGKPMDIGGFELAQFWKPCLVRSLDVLSSLRSSPLVTRSTWISSELALRCDRMWWTQ